MIVRFLITSRDLYSIYIVCAISLSCFSASISSAVVTLESIEIFNIHEWLNTKPTVYFLCQGENKTILPDVTDSHVPYNFSGEESWQPLTEFSNRKCKRCGFYEHDTFKLDDVFDQWELCPFNFKAPRGVYTRFKAKEFNATFLCPDCRTFENGQNQESESGGGGGGRGMVIVVGAFVSFILVIGVVGVYKYWQRRKRAQDQARFIKLFEDGDDIEDELGLGHVI